MKTLATRNQQLILRSQVALRNRIFNALDALRRREEGGVSVEYLGIVVVAALLIVAIAGQAPDIGEKIADGIKSQIDKVLK